MGDRSLFTGCVNMERYTFMNILAEQGFCDPMIHDHRGHGRSVRSRSQFLYMQYGAEG